MSLFPKHPDELGEDFERVDDILKMAEENGQDLSDWEANFVGDMIERLAQYGKRTRISERQMEIIDRIDARLNE